MKVIKFGGTSVGSANSILSVKRIVEAINEPLIVVVSALGGITDKLINTSKMAASGDASYENEFREIVYRHVEMIKEVIPAGESQVALQRQVGELLNELKDIFQGIYLIKDLSQKTSDTIVSYGERRQVFISGTASINNKGEVVHPGNIRKQTERMWENVEALLKEADCTFDDLGQMIVYLRDIADYAVVKEMYDKRFPATPKVFVHAPVCRPGWLIEMECMGVKALENKEYAPF